MPKLRLCLECDQEFEHSVVFDLDGTIAFYDEWKGIEHIGDPIPKAIEIIKNYLSEGTIVKIFTARVGNKDQEKNELAKQYIEQWCLKHIGQILPVTNQKDPGMMVIYDDRAKQVIPNTGLIV